MHMLEVQDQELEVYKCNLLIICKQIINYKVNFDSESFSRSKYPHFLDIVDPIGFTSLMVSQNKLRLFWGELSLS